MMEKFPNFAHTSYASLGTMVTFFLVRFYGWNPYHTFPVSMLIGGVLGIILYEGLVKHIQKRMFTEITLTFTFYIISQLIVQSIAMVSYWLLIGTGVPSSGFTLYRYDFRWNGVQGIGLVAPLTVLVIISFLWVFLKKSKYGIAMRATAENENLAMGLGVNVHAVHIGSWFMSGALAALAGSIVPLWLSTSVDYSDTLLISVMTGSVLGGLNSIIGAILGGLIVATSQKWVTWVLMSTFGSDMGNYEGLIPILVLFLILSVEPQGITAVNWRNLSVKSVTNNLIKLKRSMENVLTSE
jgi:branched-chain amino acid transport system permease protein